jgi:hypothetical protein
LVVLDNANAIDDEDYESYINLEIFLPDATTVEAIVTTRRSGTAEMTTLAAVEVEEMEATEKEEAIHRTDSWPQRPTVSGMMLCVFVLLIDTHRGSHWIETIELAVTLQHSNFGQWPVHEILNYQSLASTVFFPLKETQNMSSISYWCDHKRHVSCPPSGWKPHTTTTRQTTRTPAGRHSLLRISVVEH